MDLIHRDASGIQIPPGRVRREFVENFTPSLPSGSFLQHGPGTTGSMWGSGPWYYRLTNPTSGGTISLRGAWDIALAQYEQVELYVSGLHTNGATGMSVGIGLKEIAASPARGVGIWHNPAGPAATFRAFGTGLPDETVPYAWAGAEATRRRNIGLILRPKVGQVYVVSDDQVIWSWHGSISMGPGVRAVIDTGQTGTTGELRLAQVRLVAWHN